MHDNEKTGTSKSRPLEDSFHIFNVEQGKSQSAICAQGPGELFAVLYDFGASAK